MDSKDKKSLEPREDLIRRKKEAARRIIELSGELDLTLEDLADLPRFVRNWATLKWKED